MNSRLLHELREPVELDATSQPPGRHGPLGGVPGTENRHNTNDVHHMMDDNARPLPPLSVDLYNHNLVGKAVEGAEPTISMGNCGPVVPSAPGKYLHHNTGFDANQVVDLPLLPANLSVASYLHPTALSQPPSTIANHPMAAQLSEEVVSTTHGALIGRTNLTQDCVGPTTIQSIPNISTSSLPTSAGIFMKDEAMSSVSSDDSGIGSSSFPHSVDQSSCRVMSTSSTFQSSRSQSVSLAIPGPIPSSTPSLVSQSFSGPSKTNVLTNDIQKVSISLPSRTFSDGKNIVLSGDLCDSVQPQDDTSVPTTSNSISETRPAHKTTTRRANVCVRKTTREKVTIRDLPSDGYNWRKYGSKRLPNNAHPKSYFRCSVPGCHAKRYVTETDNRVLKTEYIGEHNHEKSSSTAHAATNLMDVCRLAALGQNFLVKSDMSFNTLSNVFLDLAILLRPSIFADEYLILNGFGSIVLDDSDRRYHDSVNGLEITEIPDSIYPLSELVSITVSLFAKGVELGNALNLAIVQLNQNLRERALSVARGQESSARNYPKSPSVIIHSNDISPRTGASPGTSHGRKLIISCKLSNYDQIESSVDFFRWKKYGHKAQTETRLDSKSYYRCAFFNCPARRTITFFHSVCSDGTETIESMIVQYENQHIHAPDITRISYKDCVKLLKPSDSLTAKLAKSVDNPLFTTPSSYLGIAGLTVAQRPVFTPLAATHMTTPINDSGGHHPITMQQGMPSRFPYGIADTNIVPQGTQIVPSIHRTDSFERPPCFLLPGTDSVALHEGLHGLHTDQSLYGCLSTPGYGASYPFNAQSDNSNHNNNHNNYSLLPSNSFLFLNQLGYNQPHLDLGDSAHPVAVNNIGSTNKIPPIMNNNFVNLSSGVEKDYPCSTAIQDREDITLANTEAESVSHRTTPW